MKIRLMNRLFAAGPQRARDLRRAAALLLVASSCHASSYENNMLNVFYFESAQVNAVDCASRGFPTKSIHADWLRTNNPIHQKILGEVIDEYLKKGLSRREAENTLLAVREQYRRMAAEGTRLDNTLCGAFRDYLSNLYTIKGSRYLPTR